LKTRNVNGLWEDGRNLTQENKKVAGNNPTRHPGLLTVKKKRVSTQERFLHKGKRKWMSAAGKPQQHNGKK